MNSEPTLFRTDIALLEAFTGLAVPVSCIPEDVLFRQGDKCVGLFILRSGHADCERCSASGQVVARSATDGGSLLGLADVVSGGDYSLTATVLHGSDVWFMERSTFLTLMSSDSALSLEAMRIVSAESDAAHAALSKRMAPQQAKLRGGKARS